MLKTQGQTGFRRFDGFWPRLRSSCNFACPLLSQRSLLMLVMSSPRPSSHCTNITISPLLKLLCIIVLVLTYYKCMFAYICIYIYILFFYIFFCFWFNQLIIFWTLLDFPIFFGSLFDPPTFPSDHMWSFPWGIRTWSKKWPNPSPRGENKEKPTS